MKKERRAREETTRRAINIPSGLSKGLALTTHTTTWPTTLNCLCFLLFPVLSLRQEEAPLPCLTFFTFILVCPFRNGKQKRWASKTIRQKKPGPINIPGLLFPTRRRLNSFHNIPDNYNQRHVSPLHPKGDGNHM